MSGIINEVRGAIHGRGYVLVRPLVEGASAVFEARHERISGTYVVRLFPPEIRPRSEAALRIQGGSRLASLLRHPGIAQVLDFNVSGQDPAFVVMEYVEGRSLEDAMAENGMLPLPLTLALAEQIADALQAAHAAGIVHGDLYPGAIRLTEDGKGKVQAKILGFGWGKELRATVRRGGGITQRAPEQQVPGAQAVDERADQFSLAAVVYEMLSGCSPFTDEGTDLAEPGARWLRRPPSLAGLVVGVPAGLDDVLRRALSTEPSQRFPRLQDFAAALRKIADNGSANAGSPAGEDAAQARHSDEAPVVPEAAFAPRTSDLAAISDPEPTLETSAETPRPQVSEAQRAAEPGAAPSAIVADAAAAFGDGKAGPDPGEDVVLLAPPLFSGWAGAASPNGIHAMATAAEQELMTPPLTAADEQVTPPPVVPASTAPSADGALRISAVVEDRTPPPAANFAAAVASASGANGDVSQPPVGADPSGAAVTDYLLEAREAAGEPARSSAKAGDRTPSPTVAWSLPDIDAITAAVDKVLDDAENPTPWPVAGPNIAAASAPSSMTTDHVRESSDNDNPTPLPAATVAQGSDLSGSTNPLPSALAEQTPSPVAALAAAALAAGSRPAVAIDTVTDEYATPLPALVSAADPAKAEEDAVPRFSPSVPMASVPIAMLPQVSSAIPIARPQTRTRLIFLTATLALVVGAVSVMSGMRQKPPVAESAGPGVPHQAASPGSSLPSSLDHHPTQQQQPGAANANGVAQAQAEMQRGLGKPAAMPLPQPVVGPTTADVGPEARNDRTRPHRGRSRRGVTHGAAGRSDHRNR